jgi:hypothetical protein
VNSPAYAVLACISANLFEQAFGYGQPFFIKGFSTSPQADPTLTTQMKSVGEAMAIGRSFTESQPRSLLVEFFYPAALGAQKNRSDSEPFAWRYQYRRPRSERHFPDRNDWHWVGLVQSIPRHDSLLGEIAQLKVRDARSISPPGLGEVE